MAGNIIWFFIISIGVVFGMPDVIEMPYTPPLYGADEKNKHLYRLAGPTCFAGDVSGDYGTGCTVFCIFNSPPTWSKHSVL